MDNVIRRNNLKPSQVIMDRARQLSPGNLGELAGVVTATLEFLDVFRESLQESNREASQVVLNALQSTIDKVKETIDEQNGPWSS